VSTLSRIAAWTWNDRGPWGAALRLGLAPAAVVYGVAARGRNFLYDRRWLRAERGSGHQRGNLTGGTGKTPSDLACRRIERRPELRSFAWYGRAVAEARSRKA
jgi:hypothetical protein